MTVTRRHVLGALGLGTAALTTGALWRSAGRPIGSTGTLLRSSVPVPGRFEVPLPIPAPARMTRSGAIDRVALVAREADAEILPGRRTRIWGYDGTFPGPTVRARSGRPLELELRNALTVPMVLHLHGGHTPPESDGYPTDYVLPQGVPEPRSMGPRGVPTTVSRTYRYPLEQPAATLWYHDHAMDFTGPNVYRGLAGMFVVEDAHEEGLGLPSGERDLPLVLADRSFGGDAELLYPALAQDRARPGVESRFMGGVLGDVVLVNGAPWPVHEVAAARYRLRLLNASSARRYDLALEGAGTDRPFVQVGTDQGLLDRPRRLSSVTIAQGERVDVVVDFGDLPVGSRVTLTDRLDPDVVGGVLQFVVARRAGSDDTRVPDRLVELDPIEPGEAALTRNFHFSLLSGSPYEGMSHGGHDDADGPVDRKHRWTVNGVTFGSGTDVARPTLGSVERWRFTSDVHHPVHVHLLRLQVVGGDGGWKDTIDLRPGTAVEVLTRIEGYRGRYVMHCHNLEHEDMAMMANFTIV